MRRLFLLLIFVMPTLASTAQCVPDSSITHNVPGIYPDSVIGLPHAIVGVAYSTDIQINVAASTMVGPLTFMIDSIIVTSVTGLPPGFTYICTPSNCTFPSLSNGCVLLQGPAPTSQMIGTYPLSVNYTGYGTVSGIPNSGAQSNTAYSIIIENSAGISTIDRNGFSAGQNLPNPAKSFTVVPVVMNDPGEVSLTVSNVIGKNVFNKKYALQKGKNNITIDLHNLQPGIYLYTISQGGSTVTRRMIISAD